MSEPKRIDPQASLRRMWEGGPKLAQAKANRVYMEEYRKTLKAILMKQSGAKSSAEQERDAYSHQQYEAHLLGLQAAVEAEERGDEIVEESAIVGGGHVGVAGRGEFVLIGALDAFEPAGLTVVGRRCLDAGASTGGFTDVLLDRGAESVAAVDVGYGQLVWRLRSDERVHVFDRTNVRSLTPEQIGGPVDLTVTDLSFISLRLVLPALAACTLPAQAAAKPMRDSVRSISSRISGSSSMTSTRLSSPRGRRSLRATDMCRFSQQ